MNAQEKYLEIMRKKTPEERLKIAFKLNEMVKEASRTDIRFQNPNMSVKEIEERLQKRIRLYESLKEYDRPNLRPEKNN